MEKNNTDNEGTGLEFLVEGQTSPDETLPPGVSLPPDATRPIGEETRRKVGRRDDVGGVTQPISEETRERVSKLAEVNRVFQEKLGGKVLINTSDGRAVEFDEVIMENGKANVRLRQLGGSTVETVDESQIRFDESTGELQSDDWRVVQVIKESDREEAA